MSRPLVAALMLVAASYTDAVAQTRALVGATVIDGTGAPAIDQGVIVVDGTRLMCVGTATECPVPPGAERTDLTGRFVTPGMVDAHVHFSQTGWLDGRPDGLAAPDLYPYRETALALRARPERWFRSYLCTGITAVYDVGGHPWTTALPARAERDVAAPHVRAAGPLVTHAAVPALNVDDEIYTFLPMATSDDVRASVRRLVAMGASAVKVWYLAPPPARRQALDARLMEVGAAARDAKLDLIVHATSLREAKLALRAGAKLLVHSVQDTLVDEEFLALLAANDAIYAPTLVVAGNWSRAIASVILNAPYPIDDPNGCVDSNTVAKVAATEALRAHLPERLRSSEVAYQRLERSGAARWVMAENLRRVHGAGRTVAAATDAGNPLTLHGPSIHQELEAMQAAGLSTSDIIVMATRNGALAMGRLDDFGTLEAGKLADLLVLTEDPRADVRAFRSLTYVMRAGRLHAQRDLAY
ncbi:MAG: amidohydrolase family protein [Gemmatimonadota bacterium]|nr:amidohydrolase family protein [Gemmatimonadota bacterium]